MNLENIYLGDIVKKDKTAEGDIIIYGKATGPDLDLDGDRCDPKWLKSAMPAWFEWGNVREQHSQIAAGVGIELTPEGDDWYVKARITDPVTAHKIETGTLKGLSIGIRNGARETRDGQNWITRGDVIELSVVDRPANPTATMSIAKSVGGNWEPIPVEEDINKDVVNGKIDETSDIAGAHDAIATVMDLIGKEMAEIGVGANEDCDIEHLHKALKHLIAFKSNEMLEQSKIDADAELLNDDKSAEVDNITHAEIDKVVGGMEDDEYKYVSAAKRREYGKSGIAMPNGDFPIPDEGHLRSAVGRLGNYKGDKSAAKRHIIKRAKALGKTNLLPDDWNVGSKKMKQKSVEPTGEDILKSLDVKTLIETEISKAMAASQERTLALEAELEEIKSRPVPGGPVLIAPTEKSVSPELSKAARYRRMAATTSDPILAADYKALAEREERSVN